MRFIGNKESIVTEIYKLMKSKGLVDKGYTLFDPFSGTGTVADYLKDSFNLKVNDLLTWSVIYSRGRILANECTFEKLGFDPIEFFNNNDEIIKGFFYENYSPGGSERMYFNEKNAGRIDYFRQTIEEWFNKELINYNEYCYLLACLIESVSLVSNTAGVYGAFLKHWDSRALKDIKFIEVIFYEKENLKADFYNSRLEDIIEDVECDVLYLDPPYTQNQYGTQYHLLETLVLYDNPSISPVTGSRKTAPMRSDWSKNFKSHILLDKILAKTKARYVVLSYNVDGFMSKQFIEACFKRYGKVDTYKCEKISYKKYRNFKTKRENDHFEYLFFIEKKDINEVTYESPLNYIGSKSKMIAEMKSLMPSEIDTFIDLFGGGFNVGININSQKTIYNDTNWIVKDLVKSFSKYETYDYLMYINRTIKKFGLEASNKENYLNVRNHYNSFPVADRDPRLLYTVILYGFQQQIRFNSDYDFNNPVGMRWFNDNVLEKMVSFSRAIKEGNIEFTSRSFEDYLDDIDSNTFVYMDPPYMLTNGSYNDGKRGFDGWTIEHEQKLMDFADELNRRGVKFMISYVLEHQGEINERMNEWLKYRLYKVINMTPIPGRKRKEVVIINYELS
ncbi:Dam family site-specific DNA-(adenine-N6)-methyltransferase [Enterococcus faecium]|nr:Dam family site-specific DNA-(adenine-N6)-methyltransferase [Enterococcus casseliflavus]EGP5036516.1 Dam family site-specific DNA-(adenine-N6)-methyltransferase [Enterococcus faecium]NTK31563.1 Dam family site-specific DNA-(adenine-N6)-methyltransferase [Enterococcus faecium]HCK0308268.1 Dam family site-specific DNA-(adenine-N6)-methyltransferase [Listeria innocua]